ncbi:MAG: aminotransferase class V-fold PLP-dependent enzyme [Candidatus Eisenbacteria bacterium]|nr:aminotransferase class V-fold PLP-dependent enzyme [Candidatus Eisenbacteria bacterium]
MDINAIRSQFPDAENYVYLNNASRSILPVTCIEAMTRYMRACHKVEFEHISDFENIVPQVRSQIAELINAAPDEIALSWNTSIPLNIAAQGLPLKPGDRVIVGRSEFPANVCVWENLRRKGVEVTVLPPGAGFTTADDIRDGIDGRTRAVAISFVSFHNGYKADLEEIGEICKDAGAVLVVDGIQGVGAIDIDVKRCNVGVLAAGGQKWLLAPFGTGFLYCSPDLMKSMSTQFAGWLSVKGMGAAFESIVGLPFELVEDARRFEIGTLSYQDLAGFRESLKLILSVGVKQIQQHIFELLDILIDELKQLPVTIRSPLASEHRSGILSFSCDDTASLKVSFRMERIIVSEREKAVRVSPHLYNNAQDMEKLCRVMKTHLR